MPHREASTVIRAPIERVYAYLCDLPRMPEWCAPVVEARWIRQTPQMVDSRALMVMRVAGEPIPSEIVVLKADPPRYLSARALSGVMGTYTWKLESAPEGTRVTRIIDWAIPPTILGREIDALWFERTQSRTIDQDLDNVKAVLEHRPDEGS